MLWIWNLQLQCRLKISPNLDYWRRQVWFWCLRLLITCRRLDFRDVFCVSKLCRCNNGDEFGQLWLPCFMRWIHLRVYWFMMNMCLIYCTWPVSPCESLWCKANNGIIWGIFSIVNIVFLISGIVIINIINMIITGGGSLDRCTSLSQTTILWTARPACWDAAPDPGGEDDDDDEPFFVMWISRDLKICNQCQFCNCIYSGHYQLFILRSSRLNMLFPSIQSNPNNHWL